MILVTLVPIKNLDQNLNELKKTKFDVKLLIINKDNRLRNYKTTDSYLKEISKCKFYFCTRASVYENYSKNIFNLDYREGRFANRVSEAIICGCVPLYWQPKLIIFFDAY